MINLPAPLAAMGAYRQFILYKLVSSTARPGKTDKLPCDFRTGRVVGNDDQSCWTDAATACASYANYGSNYGVAFVFTSADNFWFLDIDGCLQPDNTWSPLAIGLCTYLAGCAIEVSSSGKGLHIFGSGTVPSHGCTNKALGLEFYHHKRFVALTGNGAIGNISMDATHLLPGLIETYFGEGSVDTGDDWTTEACEGWKGPVDDDELIRRAMRSRSTASVFGNRASFADLWEANVEALARCYPDDGRGYDSSSADAALAQHLAFWTGKDCERIKRLMLSSKLARDKFDRRDGVYGTYLRRTITNAVNRQIDILTDSTLAEVQVEPSVAAEPPAPKPVEGNTFAGNDDQIKLFSGCVYISDVHRVLIPGGRILKPDQFKVTYGGYTFTLDSANEKVTKDAWEAFTQSQSFRCPRVDSARFRPDKAPGSIFEESGRHFVNTYWPIEVKRKVGDGTPFFTHLSKLLPNERDREILLSYMAACVQHQGTKFRWAPLLQGVEGNGKDLLISCVAEAVGRRYVHIPRAEEIGEKFNSWLFDNIFIGVEDVYVPNHRFEIFEILKPMITSKYQAKRAMNTDQVMGNVVANFMFNSNHKDGLRKTKNDRRVCPLFCAQQSVDHLQRDGLTGEYFASFVEWLDADGYAIVSELLHTYPINDEFNPATKCHRAPVTSSTDIAIEASLGSIEQEIREAIDQCVPGFIGGWVSSIQLNALLERIGAARRISHSRRKDMLHDMGYDYHPALSDGRVNNTVLPDNAKPRLFVHKDSAARMITGAGDAARAYETVNNIVIARAFS